MNSCGHNRACLFFLQTEIPTIEQRTRYRHTSVTSRAIICNYNFCFYIECNFAKKQKLKIKGKIQRSSRPVATTPLYKLPKRVEGRKEIRMCGEPTQTSVENHPEPIGRRLRCSTLPGQVCIQIRARIGYCVPRTFRDSMFPTRIFHGSCNIISDGHVVGPFTFDEYFKTGKRTFAVRRA